MISNHARTRFGDAGMLGHKFIICSGRCPLSGGVVAGNAFWTLYLGHSSDRSRC